MKNTETTARRLEKVAADKGAESDALKDKLAASEVEVGALKEKLADLVTTSLRKDDEIESLKRSFDKANLKADSMKVVLDDVLKELQRLSAGAKSALNRKDEEIALLKLSSEELKKWAIEEFKSSEAFEDEVAEAEAASYDVDFFDGLK